MRIDRQAGLLLIFAIGAVLPATAAEPPAGIVMEVTGATSPPLEEMTEIPADTPVRLEAGTQLTFLHYRRCKLVTVTGGSVTLSRADYHADGQVVSEKDGPCPRVYALAEPAGAGRSSGGLVVRGIDAPPRWPVKPEIIFVGNRAGAVQAAAIYAEDQPDHPLLNLTIAGHRASCPADAAPLPPNQRYTLRVTMADQPKPVETTFIGAASTPSDSVLIVRID
jgi:hypothetical protein